MEPFVALSVENLYSIKINCEQSVEGIQDKNKIPVQFLQDSYRVSPSSSKQDTRFMVWSLQLPKRIKITAYLRNVRAPNSIL
jgi:hypothetical protein